MSDCFVLYLLLTCMKKKTSGADKFTNNNLLQYHIIFVCKYRKKLLVSRQISDDIKQFSYEICQRHSVIIRYMEKISSIFTKTILERTYLLDRWIFCL